MLYTVAGDFPHHISEKFFAALLASRHVPFLACQLFLLSLSNCGYYASRVAHKAQASMIGMNENDMQACAGIPDKIKKIDDHMTIYEYQRVRNIGVSANSTLIPVQSVQNIVSAMGGGDGKNCIADFRVVDGKVQDIYYSGDNDMLIGTDGVCSTVVRGCVRRNVASGSRPKGWISAFMEPQPEEKSASVVQTAGDNIQPTTTQPRLFNTNGATIAAGTGH
ncbi:hypothetical protein A0U92_16795 [Acetobacter aceti]|uniref:Uncharacterized protein n=1 Tax=Acetobacter aceti TaxID=435 RepID=A0A1U9KK28_ACEAC|nr:hypothetical protein [Acetobacter aceti]AQS86137.1 hypothetical protein A0U92_16795 [Acetobacter aceti]